MNIGIDIRWLKNQGGVGQYTGSILNHFSELDNKNTYFLFYDNDIKREISKSNFFYCPIKRLPFTPWTSAIKSAVRKKNIEIFFTPVISFPILENLKVFNTIHDILWYTRKNEYPRKDIIHNVYWVKKTIKFKVRTILVSPHLKDLLKKNFPEFDTENTIILPNAVPDPIEKITDFKILRKRFNIKGKFLLSVGITFPRKNHLNLIKGFKDSNVYNEYQLIIAGPVTESGKKLTSLFKKEIYSGKVIFTDYLNREELASFYKNSTAVLFPSLDEGFGIPVIEANYFQVPVLTSDVQPMNWVAGDSAILVDPEKIESIKAGIEVITLNEKIRNELIIKGNENFKRFSWKRNAEILLKEFQKS